VAPVQIEGKGEYITSILLFPLRTRPHTRLSAGEGDEALPGGRGRSLTGACYRVAFPVEYLTHMLQTQYLGVIVQV
jgi:hypothetical protein